MGAGVISYLRYSRASTWYEGVNVDLDHILSWRH